MDAVRAFLRHPSGMAGLVLLTIVLIVAITAPVVFPVSPWEMSGTPFAPPGERGLLLRSSALVSALFHAGLPGSDERRYRPGNAGDEKAHDQEVQQV